MENPLKAYKPDIDKFDIEWIDSWQEEAVTIKSFRMTTNVIDSKPVRTYGIIGFPEESGKLPAILHVHGGGQTASPENVIYNVKRGYACMSFDWTGPTGDRDESKVSHFPKEFHKNDSEVYSDPDIGNIKIACAVKAARCCLTFLASFDNVDADNIGFYGISWGGFATWLVNGTDSIAKCAVAIYGTGGLHQPRHLFNQHWLKASDQQKKNWMTVIEPRNYINMQNAPILHINATNDFFGGFDTAADMLPMINSDWRCDFTPNSNHHFDKGSDALIDYWFDHYLKGEDAVPASPEITSELKDNKTLIVRTEEKPDNYTLYYSCGTSWHYARSWNAKSNWLQDDSGYYMEVGITGETWLFVRQQRENGMTLSSTPLCIGNRANDIEKSKTLYQPDKYTGGWGKAVGTEIFHGRVSVFKQEQDCIKITTETDGFSGLLCFAPSDPICKADDNYDSLNIQLEGIDAITITAHKVDEKKHSITYTAKVETIDSTTISIAKEQFQSPENEKLLTFSGIAAFNFSGKKKAGEKAKILSLNWS
jgi:dienelactone hydrolase